MGLLRALACLLLILCASAAHAQRRVALVIGNSTYAEVTPLRNPVNDATDIADALRRLGFQVIGGFDLGTDAMRVRLREFADAASGADVALLFYAGHGLQVAGINYLLPVDTRLEKASDLDFEAVSLDFVVGLMKEARTQIVLLDACRNNPLTRRFRAASRGGEAGVGLARPNVSAEGLFVAFATEPNEVALDGEGRNSPFTAALVRNIERPGVEISELMTDVRREVYEATRKEQLPFSNSGLLGKFYFAAGEAAPANESRILDGKQIAALGLQRLPGPKAGYTDWMSPRDYQSYFDARLKERRYPAEVECAFVDNAYWTRGKFVKYPSGRFGFYSYTGMDRVTFDARRAKLGREGYRLVWQQSYSNGEQDIFCATWTQ